MGGRGASSGTYRLRVNDSELELNYGDEFRGLATFATRLGEVKVLENKFPGRRKAPMETMTRGRIYAMADRTGHISDIIFFDDDGKRKETWHLATYRKSHPHGRSANHKHIGYLHDEGGSRALNKREKRFAKEVKRKWARSAKRSA